MLKANQFTVEDRRERYYIFFYTNYKIHSLISITLMFYHLYPMKMSNHCIYLYIYIYIYVCVCVCVSLYEYFSLIYMFLFVDHLVFNEWLLQVFFLLL